MALHYGDELNLADEASKLGLKPMRFGPGVSGLGRLELGKPTVLGICNPVTSHSALLTACQWYQGSAVLIQEESPRFILWDQFFCLETTDLPRDILQLRDHFDYSLEREIQQHFRDFIPFFGPSWRYLFPCKELARNLRTSSLNLATPMMGNALNCRSDNLTALLEAQQAIRAHLATKLPIPMIWAFPEGLPVAAKDNFYDTKETKWYLAQIKSDFAGSMSVVDLRPDEAGVCRLMQHDFQGTVRAVKMTADEIIIHFTEIGGKFRSRRKLSRLKVTYFW